MMFVNKITLISILLVQALRADSATTRGGEKITRKLRGNVLLVTSNPESDAQAWETSDDPVMGGVSSSTYTIGNGYGEWEGEVLDVPSLEAPGFCSLRTGNDEIFADASGTDYITMVLGDDSGMDETGLPVESFYMTVGVAQSGITSNYMAYLSSTTCCGRYCQVAWSDFDLSIIGFPIPGPRLSGKLDKIKSVGLTTSGTNGSFSVNIKAFGATNRMMPCS